MPNTIIVIPLTSAVLFNTAYANLMNYVEEYARRWANHERQDIDTLSEWGYIYPFHIYSSL